MESLPLITLKKQNKTLSTLLASGFFFFFSSGNRNYRLSQLPPQSCRRTKALKNTRQCVCTFQALPQVSRVTQGLSVCSDGQKHEWELALSFWHSAHKPRATKNKSERLKSYTFDHLRMLQSPTCSVGISILLKQRTQRLQAEPKKTTGRRNAEAEKGILSSGS